ncbi:MAG: GNAT family N-acetyltransferase [Stenotrophomonas sp.]|uniref:GNAT family N-acetyltransferase n=1 Tax=Stenotrophomonas sp. TaxID=69392 RepID=UPI003D6D7599
MLQIAPANTEEINGVCQALQAFNHPYIGNAEALPIYLIARTPYGAVAGGILADVALGWLEIHVLWVEPSLRSTGLGKSLLQSCERQALALNAHSSRLDTFDWQAEAFYLRNGYTCFGRLADYPVGHERVFMCKRLRDLG